MDENTKKCPECGADNDAFAITCSSCGYPFSDGQVKCSECGEMIPDNLDCCPNCGAPKYIDKSVKPGIARFVSTDDSKKKRISYGLFAIAFVLLIISTKVRFFGDYDYYTEVIYGYEDNIDEYRDLKQENKAMANSFSGGILKYGYQDIANGYQDLIDDANDRIEHFQALKRAIIIKSSVCLVVAMVLIFAGLKLLSGGSLYGTGKMP